jgi:fructose-1,6-bisphosphatase
VSWPRNNEQTFAPLRLCEKKNKSKTYGITLRSLETFAEQVDAEIASATQVNKSVSAHRGFATTNKTFAPLRLCEIKKSKTYSIKLRSLETFAEQGYTQQSSSLLQPRK